MFTVLSNTRSSNLYLIAVLAVMAAVLLTFTVIPAISAPGAAAVPVSRVSDNTSDFYLRHPELSIAGLPAAEMQSDFYQRHPEWVMDAQVAAIPVTGAPEGSDYFERHSDLSLAAANTPNAGADFYLRHPEWTIAPLAINAEASDYFERHSDMSASAGTADLSDYFLRH